MQPMTPRQLLDHTEEQPQSCEPGYCDLWLVSARVDVPEREILETLLSEEERARVARFRLEEDRVRSIVARGGLRRILSSYCGAPPNRIEFQTGSHGKPALLKPSGALEFNVSHSGDCVLIGVTSGVPCGVDIEGGWAKTAELAIADRFFCPREGKWLLGADKGFLRVWATKEAIIKAVGRGLSIPLCDIDVTDILERRTTSITLRTPGLKPQTLWLNEFSLVPNYAAAVATVAQKCTVRLVPAEADLPFLEYSAELDISDDNRPE
jgi:4'-phosphopantetheinyl transferase